MLNTIEGIIEKYDIDGYTFGDLFAGTSCVGEQKLLNSILT
ncbi:hypothetical protein NKR20_15585 [Lysinibacillus endophyticus]|nr:hypothetical protein [Lysinibacillus endophyticus]